MLDFDVEEDAGPSVDLSAQIHERRTALGLKQYAIARRIGIDPSIPSQWERGLRLVPQNRIPALAAALETDVATLLGEAATPAPVQVPVVVPAPVPAPAPVPQTPTRDPRLLWCTSTHGARDAAGNPPPARLHQHGTRCSWAPGFWNGD